MAGLRHEEQPESLCNRGSTYSQGKEAVSRPRIEAPTYANIYVKPHSDCGRRETYGGTYVGTLGDVRRCEHGKVQIMVKPDRGMIGPGAWFWGTLHPVWDFGQYRKAVKALA